MPVISKIRFTNVIYEGGNKRYQDEIFHFDGQNSVIVLENGGGKTVWVQTALQAILPHTEVAGRKAFETFLLSEGCAHIAIEWVISQKPRRYVVTAVSLYERSQRLQSYRYAYEYQADDPDSIENIPYVQVQEDGGKGPVGKNEIQEYYSQMTKKRLNAHTFQTIEKYYDHLSKYDIIAAEWKKIAQINGAEGGVGKFFENCATTPALVERLLIPIVEDAISGQGTKSFVESFEKQREHIKKYKQLKRQIEECQTILDQVQGFTSSFEAWDKEQEALRNLKAKAKAVYYIIENDYEKQGQVQEAQLKDLESIKQEMERLTWKEASYSLQSLEKEVQEKRRNYHDVLEEFDKVDLELRQSNHRRTSLEYARIKQLLEDSQQEEEGVKGAIQRLSKDNAAAELEDKLEENSRYLKGYYKNALEEIEKDLVKLKNEIATNEEALKRDSKEKAGLEAEKDAMEKRKTEKEVAIGLIQEDIEALEQSILDRPDHERVDAKEIEIKQRFEEIETSIRQGFEKRKSLETEGASLGQDKAQLIKALEDVKELGRDNQNKIENLKQSQDKLLQKIHTASYRWAHIDSVYNNPLILTTVETQIEKTRLDLNKARQEERISLRWLDDYENGDYFIADSRILSRVEEWKKEFTLLQTGSEYIKDGKSGNFPYWAITLITTDKEQDKLQRYIEENKAYMTHPIWVMTDHQALYYLENAYENENNFIYPGLWETNIKQDSFKEWKMQLEETAKLAIASREEIEDSHKTWLTLKEDLLSFNQDYPLELFHELTDKEIAYKDQINRKENRLRAIYNRENEITQAQKQFFEDQGQLEKEKYSIEDKLLKINSHRHKTREKERHQKALREVIKPSLRKLKPQINGLGKNIRDLSERLDELRDYLREKDTNKGRIQDDPLYREVKNHSHLYASYSAELLTSQRQDLKRELDKQQKGRRELEDQLSKIKKDRASQENNLANHLMKYPDLDKTIGFMTEHIEEIKMLIRKKIRLEDKLRPISENKELLKTAYDGEDRLYANELEIFKKCYDQMFKWEETLSTVGINLEKERKDLSGKLNYIEDQLRRVTKEREKSKKAKDYLEKKNEAFKYLREDIAVAEIKSQEALDILYQKTKHIDEIIKALDLKEAGVQVKYDKLQKEKQAFTQYCRSNIRNMKLQELTLRGIENLASYKAVTQWEGNLYNRIMKTRKIAEDDIKTHAEELALFINFIHSYVKQVADGLGEIHRKTRVKIDDKWRNVYTITVPEWDKLRGQEAIQNHILWIIDQLESGRHPEEGQGKEIEKWLSVKQLLAVVTQSKPISVKCRKLTNQNTLSTISSSWDASNKWSGGEKWSKNMILFLGLLNFLAEKTGHVIEAGKRKRTVILDNPFGQASSDHVLSPVFFVAEQLGFQIITLTALAEGPFIRKYFPVVYSCRLRAAKDGSQIMTKEQQIQRALFKDEELPSVGRLETQEQMSLLGTNS